jgi:nanoRNase/pAp phosphatase (c-di-AMP/oligoRNAs hydrolase)
MPYSIEEIAKALKGKKKIVILTHNNPDPDAIASAWGIKYLLKELLNLKGRIVYDGFIGRAENKAMVRLLKIKLSHLSKVKLFPKDGVILVDTQPGMGNNSLPTQIIPSLVLDHHPLKKRQKSVLVDVRVDVGSTATIVTEYLLNNNLEIPRNLATALFYGISSETQGLSVETDNLDKLYYKLLFPQISQFLLSKIQYPQLEREFFLHLRKALDNAYLYKNVILINLGKISNPDLISEFCSFSLRYSKATWALAFGQIDSKIIFSIRSQNRRARAGSIAKKIAGANGSGGGHEMSAAGWIELTEKDKPARITHYLINSFLFQMGHRGDITLTPLIPRDSQGGLRNV